MIRKYFDPFSFVMNSVGLRPVMKVLLPIGLLLGVGSLLAPHIAIWMSAPGKVAHQAAQKGLATLEQDESFVSRRRAQLRSLPPTRETMFDGEASLDPILGSDEPPLLDTLESGVLEQPETMGAQEHHSAGKGFTTAFEVLFGEGDADSSPIESITSTDSAESVRPDRGEAQEKRQDKEPHQSSQKRLGKVPAGERAAVAVPPSASPPGTSPVRELQSQGPQVPPPADSVVMDVSEDETIPSEAAQGKEESPKELAFPNTAEGKKELLATMFVVGGQSEEAGRGLAKTLLEGASERDLDVMFVAALVAAKSRMRKDFEGQSGVGYFAIREEEGEKIARLAKADWKGAAALNDSEYNLTLGMDYIRVIHRSLKGNERYISIAFHLGFWRFIEIVKNKGEIPEGSERFATEVAKFKAQLRSRLSDQSVTKASDAEGPLQQNFVTKPSGTPTVLPTVVPTAVPTPVPTRMPTTTPTVVPTSAPTAPPLPVQQSGSKKPVEALKDPVEVNEEEGSKVIRKRLPNHLGLERAELILKGEQNGRPGR